MIRWGAVALLLAGLSACRTLPDGGPTFVLVRHAEKAATPSADPALTEAGRARSERLAASFPNGLVAIYTTPYQRTRQTAAPAAARHGVQPREMDPRMPAGQAARELRAGHPRGTVLVVGHSNTVPALAAALCGCEVRPISDSEYVRRITVRFDADGRALLEDRTDP